jgi:hypothetical protein
VAGASLKRAFPPVGLSGWNRGKISVDRGFRGLQRRFQGWGKRDKRFPAEVCAQSMRGKKARFCSLWGTIIAIEERAIQ